MNPALTIFVVVGVCLVGYNLSRWHCKACHRGWAVFSARGQIGRRMPVCYRCWKTHRALARSRR